MESTQPAFTLVLALAVGVLAQSAARHLRAPSIVVLLVAGVGLGPDGLGWVQPRALGTGLFAIVELAVAVILFEGGLNLELSRLRREQLAIRRLVTVGALVTLIGGAAAARALLDWPWVQALLFGGLVTVTGPTVIGPLVQELRLRPKIATVLEAEGVLIDPVGAILAVLLLELALAPADADSVTEAANLLLARLGFGFVAGIAGGLLLAGALRARRIVPEGHGNIFTLASVLLLFQGCNEVVSHSGILAVPVAGVVVGNLRTRVDRDLREFKDQLTVMLIGLLFVLLAADVRLVDVRRLHWPGVAVVLALVGGVRPLNVWLSTIGSELGRGERWFLAAVAPRGIVAAAVASITATELESRGLSGGPELRALVFMTIAGTVILAGFTAAPVASLLGVRLPGRDRVAILGAQGLGLHLAEVLREADRQVVFLDSNPQNARHAQEADFPVVFGDALQERTLARARFESVGTVIGLTPNQMLNNVFVSRSRERFHVPQGFVAAARPESGLAPEVVESDQVRFLFEGPHDVERWDVRARHGDVEIEHFVHRGGPGTEGEAAGPGELFVILAVRRGKDTTPMHADFEFRQGDRVSVAVYHPDRDDARAALRRLGLEPEPALEEVQATA